MKKLILLLFIPLIISSSDDEDINNVKIVGRMSDVMWQGKLDGIISTDTISSKGTYGLGPLKNLRGEVLIFDGDTFISGINEVDELYVKKVKGAESPFFVYVNESDVKENPLSSNVYNLSSLENFLDNKFEKVSIPFVFILKGNWKNINIHSIDLPIGSVVTSPKEAHEGLKNFTYENIEGYLVGFFSRKHQTIFTHHDTFIHCHFISNDENIMGHVDEFEIDYQDVIMSVSKKLLQ